MVELVKLGIGFVLIWIIGDWFGFNSFFLMAIYVFVVYFLLSVGVVYYFNIFEGG